MACGAPLVTTDAGALPEVVGDAAGLRVRAGDVGELTGALRQVLDSPALGKRLGVAGRQRVLERYTWRTTAQRTADWYGELLERRAGSC
jgi:glycosyltransferase involved in cell wall biosynthesis